MPETAWEKTKKYSSTAYSNALKPGFDKVYNTVDKLGAPINRLSNRVGAEAFWPTSLDKESDKAARILRSFCKDGFYAKVDEDEAQKVAARGEKLEGPKGRQRVLQRIPEKVIREAKGLAIFTTMRTGLWVSGAGGSGVLIARNQNTGEWSPPSGIMLHTAGLGFLVGVDIYDCVVVINTHKALEAFTKIRCTLGGEVSAVAGPVGLGGVLETELHKRQAPVWTYLKSRGFYAGVQVDGTIVIERTDENEVFYGERIPVADILGGRARNPPQAKYRMLSETVKAAQGEKVDESGLPAPGLAPGDLDIEPESEWHEKFYPCGVNTE
jgi:lipid-binding SYLF domain-containing protein